MQLVRDTNAQAKAYAFIKEEILALRLAPLSRLHLGDLATALDLSRTPIREALGRLEQDGLVTRDAGGGFSVRAISLGEILSFYRVREALEVEAALEAHERMSPEKLEELASILSHAKTLLEPAQYAEFVLVNRAFHAAVVRAAENVAYTLVMAPIIDRVRLVGAMLIKLHGPRQQEVYEENFRILRAFEIGDPELIEVAVRDHVRKAREHAGRLLSSKLGALVLNAST